MSETKRPKLTRMTICDLCDEEIPDGQPDETASLTAGYLAHPVEMPRTKRVWLIWPPPSRRRRFTRGNTDLRNLRYDFHAECILRLVESGISPQADDEATR